MNGFVPRVIRPLLSLLSPGGSRARLSILIYHRVLAEVDPLLDDAIDAATFRMQMQIVKRFFNVVTLTEAVEGLSRRALPSRPACITFDDGYRDNFEVALPILQKLGMPATFFVATHYLDGGIMFNDSVREGVRLMHAGELDLRDMTLGCYRFREDTDRLDVAAQLINKIKYLDPIRRNEMAREIAARTGSPLRDDLMMTSGQVRGLAASGMTIGAHTRTHPILSRVSDRVARDEIIGGREDLEEMLRQPVRLFAYPNGKPNRDYDERHVGMVRHSGFDAAVSTAWGVSTTKTDRYQLARFTPWDQTPGRFAARLSKNLMSGKADHAA